MTVTDHAFTIKDMLKKISLVLILFLSACLGFSAELPEPFQEPFLEYKLVCGKPGGRLVLALSSDPKSFNPIVASETSTTQITSFLFEGLVRLDPKTLEIKPALAQSWVNTEPTVWIFNLREDIFFSDGHLISADDVVFTFNQLIYNPAIPSGSRDIFTLKGQPIKVEKLSLTQVKFTLPTVFAPFLRSMTQEILPQHQYQNQATQGKFIFSMGLDSKPQEIVGSGPFRLKKYLPGERVELERNPYYYRKDLCNQALPYLEKIVFLILPGPDTAMLKFLSAELDVYSLTPRDLAILGPLQKKNKFTVYNAGPSFAQEFLAFNQNSGINPKTKKPFISPMKLKITRDKRFRQAINCLINREKIVKLAVNGLGLPAYSAISPADKLYYEPDLPRPSFSPQKAKEIFGQIGLCDNNRDGFLEMPNGEVLEFNLVTNADAGPRLQTASIIAKDLNDNGIKTNLSPLDFNNLVNRLTVSRDWDFVLIGLTGSLEPYFGKNVWSSKGALHFWNLSGQAQDSYETEIENIFEASASEIDQEKRKVLFSRWQKIVAQEVPLSYTIVNYSLYAVRNRFGNLYPTVLGGALGEIEYVYEIK